jgi:hypothetical protein
MLVTLQLLQSELSQLQFTGHAKLGTSKVAVVLPHASSVSFDEPVEELIAKAIEQPIIEEKPWVPERKTPEKKPEEKKTRTEIKKEENYENYMPRNGNLVVNGNHITKKAESRQLFDPLVEIPTLSQQQSTREINQAAVAYSESVNDRLKFGNQELGEVLKQEPIKDLRKAIGINDRFVFINDLFRGDEAMYERSIKTINSFSIFPEAEYWINRELIVKIGWDVENSIVNHFYNLVKRRFSAM